MDAPQENNKRIAKNTLMLYIQQILVLIVALYSSRVLLDKLGVTDYGIYNLVGGIVFLFNFINSAMISATQRFMAIDIGRKDYARLRITFNATQVIHIAIAIIVLAIAFSIGPWIIKNYLVIPTERLNAALCVFVLTVLSFAISVIQAPYNAIVIAEEKMSVFASISILDSLLKLLIVIILPYIRTLDLLIAYSAMLFFVSFVIALIYRMYVSYKFTASRFLIVKDKKYYKTLLSYSGWNLFGNLGNILQVQGIDIVSNIFFGPTVNAGRAIAKQATSGLRVFYTNFQMASNPQIFKYYASGNIEGFKSLIFRTSKFSFYILSILAIPVLIEIDFILNLWLTVIPPFAKIFLILSIINAMIDCSSRPPMTGVQATGNVKWLQIIDGLLVFLPFPFSLLFFSQGYPPYIPYILIISSTFIAVGIRLYLLHYYVEDFSPIVFLKDIVFKQWVIILLGSLPALIISFLLPTSLVRVLIVFLTSTLCLTGLILRWGVSNSERKIISKVYSKTLGLIRAKHNKKNK